MMLAILLFMKEVVLIVSIESVDDRPMLKIIEITLRNL